MTIDLKIREEIEKINEALFQHGKFTPELSMNLPDGQLTISEANTKILDLFKKLCEEISEMVYESLYEEWVEPATPRNFEAGKINITKFDRLVKERLKDLK